MLIQREICMFKVLLFQITDLFLFKCKNAPKQAKKKKQKNKWMIPKPKPKMRCDIQGTLEL